jgi:hypothetical protein
MLQLGACSPSRRVVSNIFTCSQTDISILPTQERACGLAKIKRAIILWMMALSEIIDLVAISASSDAS